MIILTNVKELMEATHTVREAKLGEMHYVNDSEFNLAGMGADIVISTNTEICQRACLKYIDTKFVCPKGSFPCFDAQIYTGFDLLSFVNRTVIDLEGDVCFVVTKGFESIKFAKKLESIYNDVKIFGGGVAFGISQIGPIHVRDTSMAYGGFKIVGADDPSEIYKALALNKICLTPFDFPNCHNIFDKAFNEGNLSPFKKQKEFALENTYFDVMSVIFNGLGDQLSAQAMLDTKENLLAKNR